MIVGGWMARWEVGGGVLTSERGRGFENNYPDSEHEREGIGRNFRYNASNKKDARVHTAAATREYVLYTHT